ncbi:DUF6346 domain-containing protein [Lentzea sp. BCCO 10_0856]|uniref:DUF6346 domain-containing protein n=1 Tax=Lentzea miocenica TaxID=3095431 RepID=A0ABU4T257_9PSEU|nr:DUF6346 domain-containing protein [Lentzea sp. BCCO 10_0856]MDX8032048.1 DUF6346 domain-containing protein [Lentzea sp. BCCO 10_0856]
MKVLRRVVAVLVLPFLGYLIGATIFLHFWNQAEPGDVKNANLVAVAKSCERNGPVTLRRLGFYYTCEVEVRIRSDNETYTSDVTGWLAPEDIGKEYAVHTLRRGPLSPDVRPDSQILLGWLCTFVFGIVFLLVYVNILRFLLPDRGPRKRRMPTRYEPPTT